MKKTKLTIVCPHNNIIYETDKLIKSINYKNLKSWETAAFADVLQSKIDRFLIKGGVPIGGSNGEKFLLVHGQVDSNDLNVKMNVVENDQLWDKTLKTGEKIYLQYFNNTLIFDVNGKKTTLRRINGTKLNSTWISDDNDQNIYHTKNELNLEFRFLGRKLYDKSLSFPLFSYEKITKLDNWLNVRNGNETSSGWGFIDRHLFSTIEFYLSQRDVYETNRFVSTDGWAEADDYIKNELLAY